MCVVLLCGLVVSSRGDLSEHTVFVVDKATAVVDTIPPPSVTIDSVQVYRGYGAIEYGDGRVALDSESQFGHVILRLVNLDGMSVEPFRYGYRFEHIEGALPPNMEVPASYLRPLCQKNGSFVILHWDDGGTWVQEPFRFELAVVAVDSAGNESERSNIVVVSDDGEQSDRHEEMRSSLERRFSGGTAPRR